MELDLRSVVVQHPTLGRLELVDLLGEGGAAVVYRARDEAGQTCAVKLGRARGRAGPGLVEAFATSHGPDPRIYRKELTAELIDAALEAEAWQLSRDGACYRTTSYGVGQWFDPDLSRHRPALVTGEITGRDLSTFDPEDWYEEAWQIVHQLLVMVTVTRHGEEVPHRDLKARNVLLGLDNQLHLIDPGVELGRTDPGGGGPVLWVDGETVALTTFAAYPILAPGTPGADLQAIGLMVYQGITGRQPFGEISPAPRSYNFACGRHGRGVLPPEVLVGQIIPPSHVSSLVTPEMEALVMALISAPLDHDLDLGHGRTMREWAELCHTAADSVR